MASERLFDIDCGGRGCDHFSLMAAMEATWWLNEHLEAWLGEENAADTLAQSVPHNVTSEMG
ncbi:MAG: hypothetical protein IT304_13250 [Dehalococcoidia bacterium]|nr:hypothetical protein [Dehalococcoidia bacterium]